MIWKRKQATPKAEFTEEAQASTADTSTSTSEAHTPSVTPESAETPAGPAVFEFGGAAPGDYLIGVCNLKTDDRIQPCAWRIDSTASTGVQREKYHIEF
ncbi:hypothetical protein WJX73_007413 [Symbiochloris irregularis]|uniref:Uncharacterized protein n=1 Tax=Symbiochloris irregularis TaxID=706552 RepID=A0AAW1Q0I7_9CHLO